MHLAGILSAIILLFKNSFGYNTTILYQIINSFVSIIAYTIFYTTISFLLEKNGSGIIACMFVPNLIPTALTLLNFGWNMVKKSLPKNHHYQLWDYQHYIM